MDSFHQIFFHRGGDDEPDEEPEEFTPPPWFGPSADEIGECVPLSVVIGRSEKAVVAVRYATAYSTGVALELVAAARGLPARDTNTLFHEQHPFEGDDDPPDGFLRVGIELADGTRISNLGRDRRVWRPNAEPPGAVFMPCGGGGGSAGAGRVTMNPGYWLWPLPPPGRLRLFVEWPALGVELSHVDIDSGLLVEAAGRSQLLWSD